MLKLVRALVMPVVWCRVSLQLNFSLSVPCLAIEKIITMFNILLSLVRKRRTLNTKQEVAKMGTMLKSQRFIRTIPKEKQIIEPVFSTKTTSTFAGVFSLLVTCEKNVCAHSGGYCQKLYLFFFNFSLLRSD